VYAIKYWNVEFKMNCTYIYIFIYAKLFQVSYITFTTILLLIILNNRLAWYNSKHSNKMKISETTFMRLQQYYEMAAKNSNSNMQMK